jgi:hypothetical protein
MIAPAVVGCKHLLGCTATHELRRSLSAEHRLPREANAMHEHADSMANQPSW